MPFIIVQWYHYPLISLNHGTDAFLLESLITHVDFSVLAFLLSWNLLRFIHMDESSL